MPNKKSNHNRKGELGCVLGPLLKCYHKTVKVSSGIWHTICIYIKDDQTIKFLPRQSSMTSNKGIIHKDMVICGIFENGVMESVLGQRAER